MDDRNMKFVAFDRYCPLCKNKDTPEEDLPCAECLEIPARENTAKPCYFKEA